MSKKGFTLAEVMVVLFVMAIILAAFAPLMTTRTKIHKTSPWNYATPDSANTYFGTNANQRVLIGQKTKGSDIDNKLTINKANSSQAHILLKQGNASLGIVDIDERANYIISNRSPIASEQRHNVALGGNALASMQSGWNNIALGGNALVSLQSAWDNVAVGVNTLNAFETGSANVAVGSFALNGITSGHANTAIGYQACKNIGTSATGTTCLGAESGPGPHSFNISGPVYIGNEYSTVKILGYLEAASSNISSDARLKKITGENRDGLAKIKKIKPVNFTFKNDEKQTPRVGVIAQDLQKIFPNAVTKGDDGFLRIRQEDMFYAMVNAIKELAEKFNKSSQRLDEIERKQKLQDERLRRLEEKLK